MVKRIYPRLSNGSQLKLYKPKENAKHIVIWSGGADSTFLLYELLAKYGAENVSAISCIYPWLDKNKRSIEEAARGRIKEKLYSFGENFRDFKHLQIEVKFRQLSEKNINYNGAGLLQAFSWVSTILPFTSDGDWIYTGYIRGDDLVTMYLEEYKDLFEAGLKLLNRDVTLCMPYGALNKSDILVGLMKADLYDSIWYCESPETNVPCGKCAPCKHHMAALIEIALRMVPQSDDACIAKAMEELRDKFSLSEEMKKLITDMNGATFAAES